MENWDVGYKITTALAVSTSWGRRKARTWVRFYLDQNESLISRSLLACPFRLTSWFGFPNNRCGVEAKHFPCHSKLVVLKSPLQWLDAQKPGTWWLKNIRLWSKGNHWGSHHTESGESQVYWLLTALHLGFRGSILDFPRGVYNLLYFKGPQIPSTCKPCHFSSGAMEKVPAPSRGKAMSSKIPKT